MNRISFRTKDPVDLDQPDYLETDVNSSLRMELFTSLQELLAIQRDWDELYSKNSELSPFQSFAWNVALIKNNAYNGLIHCCCVYKRDKLVLIAPLVRHDKLIYRELHFLGADTHADYLNFIYCNDLQYGELLWFIKKIVSSGRNIILRLDLIWNKSRIGEYIRQLPFGHINYCITCVKIPVFDCLENYQITLSKRVRSKIRRCTNHLESDLLAIEYRFKENIRLSLNEVDELIFLYTKRRIELKQEVKAESLSALRQYLLENQNVFLAGSYINGKIVAFFLGLIAPSGNICSPITAHDTDYKDYSLGYLLLYNTMCYLIQQNRAIDSFDLARGTEEYKYKLGGVEHLCQNYILSKRKFAACLYLYLPYFKMKCSNKFRDEVVKLATCLSNKKK